MPFPAHALTVYHYPARKIRLGRPHDGGYVIADLPGGYDVLLSGGLGDDDSFERAILAHHSDIPAAHIWDATVASLPSPHPLLRHHRKNIGPAADPLTENLHAHLAASKNAFLKLDIEGSEYAWASALPPHLLASVRQLVVEIHDPWAPYRWEIIELLAAHLDLIHLHPNNYGTVRTVEGIALPQCLELTYIRKPAPGAPPRTPSRELIPTPLDQKNHPGAPDITLRGHPYPSPAPL